MYSAVLRVDTMASKATIQFLIE